MSELEREEAAVRLPHAGPAGDRACITSNQNKQTMSAMITLYHCDAARSFRPLWMLEELSLTARKHSPAFAVLLDALRYPAGASLSMTYPYQFRALL